VIWMTMGMRVRMHDQLVFVVVPGRRPHTATAVVVLIWLFIHDGRLLHDLSLLAWWRDLDDLWCWGSIDWLRWRSWSVHRLGRDWSCRCWWRVLPGRGLSALFLVDDGRVVGAGGCYMR
jgi:hypothetical protein